MTVEIRVPDIGDFKDIPIIEVHVAPGQAVNAEDPLITLESDKATMDVPAPRAGTVTELRVKQGDRVSEGDLILLLEEAGAATTPPRQVVREDASPLPEGPPPSYGSPSGVYDEIEVVVPDIGDFHDVPVIEVHVAPGSAVKAEESLITLESDKASMDVPAPVAGVVASVLVKPGDRVSMGDRILRLRGEASAAPSGSRAHGTARAGTAAACAREGRSARRGAGARRRAGRLQRRVPRRRSRQAGGAGRSLGNARRRVPQCRLHSVEGAAARGESHRGQPGHGRARHRLRARRRSTSTGCAAGRTAW